MSLVELIGFVVSLLALFFISFMKKKEEERTAPPNPLKSQKHQEDFELDSLLGNFQKQPKPLSKKKSSHPTHPKLKHKSKEEWYQTKELKSHTEAKRGLTNHSIPHDQDGLESSKSQGAKLIKKTSLRQMMLYHEILSKPKGLER